MAPMTILIHAMTFGLIALSAKQVGKFFSKYGIPYITGYLLVGALAGPFALNILPSDATADLRFVDNISLAVIAFIAGSELYLKELRDRLRGILLNVAGITTVAFTLIGVVLYFLQAYIPFTANQPPVVQVAISILGATILLALSPPSTIAIIQEVRAKGAFTRTILSITVLMDVVIIILFAIGVAVAGALIESRPLNLGFMGLLLLDLIIAVIAGYTIGQLMSGLMATGLNSLIKASIILVTGFLIFEVARVFPDWSYALIGIKLKIEPLFVGMVAGFTITNFTQYNKPFEDLLHSISPYAYVAFFTLTGQSLKLDLLVTMLGIAVILFLVRIVSIAVGSFVGGTLAGETQRFRRFAWMGLITQAGIALGLAREVSVTFPDRMGGDFSTLVVAVIVLNEVFGPLFLKYVLRRVGEARTEAGSGEGRSILILGIEPQSITLSRQLTSDGWRVVVVDTHSERVEQLATDDIDARYIPQIDEPTLLGVLDQVDAVVTLMDADPDNLRVCELARDIYEARSVVVRPRDLGLRSQFEQLGARVLDPASAFVNLLHQYVRAPEATDLLLQQDPEHEVKQVTVAYRSIAGFALRDLRLPNDVLILEIRRDNQVIVPHGFTVIQLDDEVTLLGSSRSLAEATLKLGY